jgi:hypothetical protein
MKQKVLIIGSGRKINLRLFADLDTILKDKANDFVDSPDFGTSFGTMTEKLKGLGYDVLINNRAAGEFIPSTRFGEVVAQRDSFKTQAEQFKTELDNLKKNTNVSPEVKQQLDALSQNNDKLLKQLEESQITTEIMACAVDAHNPKDVAAFVNREKITIDKNGNVHGIKDEITRIRAEKPYMFKTSEQPAGGAKGGADTSGAGSGGAGKVDMNAAIRRAAGHI